MPQVGNKKFPYTPSGIRRAQQAMKRKQNPIASTVERFQSRRRFGGALDQLRTENKLRERAENLSPLNQVRADAPNQRLSQGSPRKQRIDRLQQIGQNVAQRPTKKVFGATDQVRIQPVNQRRPLPVNQKRPMPIKGGLIPDRVPPNQRLGSPNRRPPIFKFR